MEYFDHWYEYDQLTKEDAKRWDMISKRTISVMNSVTTDHDLIEHEFYRTDVIPIMEISIKTYYKNKHYTANIHLPMTLLVLLSETQVRDIIILFVQSFRKSFGDKYLINPEPVPDPVKKQQSSDINGRFNDLDM
jgi:hypothetical protein